MKIVYKHIESFINYYPPITINHSKEVYAMRKASLNLSVNAIIIFVLAFVMLGVGMYVTNQLRSTSESGLNKAKAIIDAIEEDPSSDKPLVGVGKELDIKAKKELLTGIKFYNKDRDPMNNSIVVIDSCKDTTTGEVLADDGTGSSYPVTVVSQSVSIEPSSFEGIPFVVTNNLLIGGQTYICKIHLVDDDGLGSVRHSHSFFLNVRS